MEQTVHPDFSRRRPDTSPARGRDPDGRLGPSRGIASVLTVSETRGRGSEYLIGAEHDHGSNLTGEEILLLAFPPFPLGRNVPYPIRLGFLAETIIPLDLDRAGATKPASWLRRAPANPCWKQTRTGPPGCLPSWDRAVPSNGRFA